MACARPAIAWHSLPILALWGSVLLLPRIGVAAQPPNLEALMALLGRVERVEVDYQETVESGLLETAVSTRGRLLYEAPDRIRRISDRNDGFDLDGERIQLISNGEVVTELVVSDIAPLEAMLGTLRACFAGDLATLRADYKLDYEPGEQHWSLRLEPRSGALSGLFRRVEMRGEGAIVLSIGMLEADGDRRTMRMRLVAREPADLG
jgi:outer membrane lipoprotein-sorting protein